MITPKTDWQDGDYFEAEDYNRIASNLNELAVQCNIAQSLLLSQKQIGDTLENVRNDIPNLFNQICAEKSWKYHVDDFNDLYNYNRTVDFFSADELNLIESICAIPATEAKAEYSAGLIYDTGAKYGGGALG